jgi:hypothetical protein
MKSHATFSSRESYPNYPKLLWLTPVQACFRLTAIVVPTLQCNIKHQAFAMTRNVNQLRILVHDTEPVHNTTQAFDRQV